VKDKVYDHVMLALMEAVSRSLFEFPHRHLNDHERVKVWSSIRRIAETVTAVVE
jgi:hypothetical protein